jgi:Zn-dependent protease
MFFDTDLPRMILSILAVIIALSIHEFSHGLIAYKLGDNTAKSLGRLTINPLKHLDPIGALTMLFFRFGWAKPVPINPRNFKKPKRDFALTALAGPLSNIILAFFSALLFLIFLKLYTGAKESFLNVLLYNTCLFFSIFTSLNIGLGVFNLIPVPPFDGSRILNVILPEKLYFKIMKYERRIYLFVILWLFAGGYAYSLLMNYTVLGSIPVINNILRILDLSGLIGEAINFLYYAMISFWQLIPALK